MGGGEESLGQWSGPRRFKYGYRYPGKLFGHGFSRSESVLPDLDYRLIWP